MYELVALPCWFFLALCVYVNSTIGGPLSSESPAILDCADFSAGVFLTGCDFSDFNKSLGEEIIKYH